MKIVTPGMGTGRGGPANRVARRFSQSGVMAGLIRLMRDSAGSAQTIEEEVVEAPGKFEEPGGGESAQPDVPWIVIVWNDPINLMSYVVYVFQKLFGYSREKATKLMLDVHHKGRAVVSSGSREKAESDVFRLHAHGLWATLTQDR